MYGYYQIHNGTVRFIGLKCKHTVTKPLRIASKKVRIRDLKYRTQEIAILIIERVTYCSHRGKTVIKDIRDDENRYVIKGITITIRTYILQYRHSLRST